MYVLQILPHIIFKLKFFSLFHTHFFSLPLPSVLFSFSGGERRVDSVRLVLK